MRPEDIHQKIETAKDALAVSAGSGYSLAAIMGWMDVLGHFVQLLIGVGTLIIIVFRIRRHIKEWNKP